MPDIRQLPPGVVNKIAAGEVVERPASVVKELMENAVDSSATRLDVAVEKGGIELVRVADNGCGIRSDQMTLAVASHATSKISSADDLFDIRTLGFRGEALASIAEVSRFRMRSRTGENEAGTEMEVLGGQLGDLAPCGCPVGTIVEVRQLFYNTPVRRKFLRTTQTEMGHVTEAFTRIALVYPRVHFTLRHNERTIYDLPPVESWRERITTFFGTEIGDGLIPVESDDGQIRLAGYVANPSLSRSNNRMQYLFLNGRHIRDRALQHALGEAYRGLLLTGRFPVAFLRLEIPANAVDVNVHPTKLEVRFQDGGRIYKQMLGTLRKKFLTTDLTAKVTTGTPAGENDPAAAHDTAQADRHRNELVQWAKGQLPDVSSGGAGSPRLPEARPQQARFDLGSGDARRRVPEFQPFPDATRRPLPGTPPAQADGGGSPASSSWQDSRASTDGGAAPPQGFSRRDVGIQVHNRYLIAEDDSGVVIIDQHALHERILYEQLREKVLSGTLERQSLLVPEPVSLTPTEAAAALEAKDKLGQLGIEIEPFGGDTILVSSYPAMLANFNPAEVLRHLVERMMSEGTSPEPRDLLDEMLHMISCKAAIKAGDRLAPEEVTALLEQRHLFQDTHHCPHGRPTALVFTNEELDKRFKRT